jgi:hypothetical protein
MTENKTCKDAEALGHFGTCTDDCPFPDCLYVGNKKEAKSEVMRQRIVKMFKEGLEPYQIARLTNYRTKTVMTFLQKKV